METMIYKYTEIFEEYEKGSAATAAMMKRSDSSSLVTILNNTFLRIF